MRTTLATLALCGLVAAPLGAQDRSGRYGSQGIPPGQLPAAGECRVWYENRPPGKQPKPTDCRQAERVASRDRNAHVIYGRNTDWRDAGAWDPRNPSDRGYQRPDSRYPYPDRYPGGRGAYGYGSVAFDNGYKDGHDKGRDDGRDEDSYDVTRHSRYRSADHGYDKRYGTKDDYKNAYRDGFRAGYDNGYRETGAYVPTWLGPLGRRRP